MPELSAEAAARIDRALACPDPQAYVAYVAGRISLATFETRVGAALEGDA